MRTRACFCFFLVAVSTPAVAGFRRILLRAAPLLLLGAGPVTGQDSDRSGPVRAGLPCATANAARSPANAAATQRSGYITSIPPEAPDDREARHGQVARRRAGPIVIVHRGAWAFAPENTLEAYVAAMDCGADGCEIDIRRTADGVLVMFHDDGLDRMTDALGRINQHTYAELLAIRFRPGSGARPDTRIPTLTAVLELARRRAMLLHLDVKEPGLEEDIARLLDAADMWNHIVEINPRNAATLRGNPKVDRLTYKAFGWQEVRMDMDPGKVKAGLAKPGHMIMVDDPRVAARELKRTTLRASLPDHLRAPWPSNLAAVASTPGDTNLLSPAALLRSLANRVDPRSLNQLEALLASDSAGRADLGGDAAHQRQRARRILERAWAAEKIGQQGDRSADLVRRLQDLVAHRSLHRDWAYHGLDGAVAVRSLGALGATESVPFLVQRFLAVDPELKKMVDPPATDSHTRADSRLKLEIVRVLGDLHCNESKTFLRGYLDMDAATAAESATPLFEEATRALLAHQVTDREVQALLQSTNSAIRGTAILVCLDDRTGRLASLLEKAMPWTQDLPKASE
jgi:hypothetical protein